MKDYIENVIVQINGGDIVPTSKLMERELYIDTATGYLYVGKTNKTPYKINSEMADRVGTINSTFYVSSTDTSAYLGGIQITSDGKVSSRSLDITPEFIGMNYSSPVITNSTLTGGTWNQGSIKNAELVSSKKVSSDIVIVGTSSYGTQHPDDRSDLTPKEGQIYFKIS